MNDDPILLVDTTDGIATITLNRPGARNALSRSLLSTLWDAVASAGDDPEVRAIVLTGADPAFSAGIDLRELAGDPPSEVTSTAAGPVRDVNGLYRYFPVVDVPVIGAVNGPAYTGGLEVALQCTFLVASTRATFADTHVKVGVMPGAGMTPLLAQSIGWRRAVEMSLTGTPVGAEEALRLGLVNHVVPHEELLSVARRIAASIAANPRRGVDRLLDHYRRMANAATLDEAHLLEGAMSQSWEIRRDDVVRRRDEVTRDREP